MQKILFHGYLVLYSFLLPFLLLVMFYGIYISNVFDINDSVFAPLGLLINFERLDFSKYYFGFQSLALILQDLNDVFVLRIKHFLETLFTAFMNTAFFNLPSVASSLMEIIDKFNTGFTLTDLLIIPNLLLQVLSIFVLPLRTIYNVVSVLIEFVPIAYDLIILVLNALIGNYNLPYEITPDYNIPNYQDAWNITFN